MEVLVCIRLEEGGKEMYVCISLFCIKGSPLNGCKGRKEGGINWKKKLPQTLLKDFFPHITSSSLETVVFVFEMELFCTLALVQQY